MSTIIKFTNFFDEVITSQQKDDLSEFTEQTFENGRLKKEIKYYDNQIDNIYVYIYPDENVSVELGNLTKLDFSYIIAKDYEELNGYITWKYYDYKNDILDPDYDLKVIDSEGRDIAYAIYNPNDTLNQLLYKKYYLRDNVVLDENGEIDMGYENDSYVLFDYSSGSLRISTPLETEDVYTSVNRFTQDWQVVLPLMTPQILAYFTSVNPVIPPANLNL